MLQRFLGLTLFAQLLTAILSNGPCRAAIPTCDLHSGMKVWFIDYAENDYTSSHPLGVLEGTIDINDREWDSKCRRDGPEAKIYVPFNYIKNGKHEWDTRWPQDIYRTKTEAQRALKNL